MKKRLMFVATALILAIAVLFTGCGKDKEEETTKPTQSTTQETQAETTQEETTSTTATETQATPESSLKLCLYYKVGSEFRTRDISEYASTVSIEQAQVFYPKDVEIIFEEGSSWGDYYIEPEMRLYGVNENATVSVVYESEGSKAENAKVEHNKGISDFYYWNVEIIDKPTEGVYSFKITISEEKEKENGEKEEISRDIFYKIALVK